MANVNVTYEEMKGAGNRLKAGRQEIEANLQQLQRLVADLVCGGYVTDTSSKAFQASYDEFTHGATQTITGLDGMAAYLSTAADAFRGADEQLASALG